MADAKPAADKKKRIALAKALGVGIPPVRGRVRLDEQINHDLVVQGRDLERQLEEIRLKGAPPAPKRPATLPRTHTDAQKEKHDALRKKYMDALEVRDKYASDDYKHLMEQAELLHDLTFMAEHLMATNKDTKVYKANEAKYKEITEKLAKADNPHHARVEGVNLKDPKEVQARINSLVKENGKLDLIIRKHKLSSDKYHISDSAMVAIATLQEKVVEELAEHAISRCVAGEHKRVGPDHAISGAYRKLSTYPLWATLPCVKRVEERNERLARYEVSKREAYKKWQKRVARDEAVNGKPAKKEDRPKFEYPSFDDEEVDRGKARKYEETKVNKAGEEYLSTTYSWIGIDEDENEVEQPYAVYVTSVFRNQATAMEDDGEVNTEGVLVSTSMRKFLNDICCELINRLAPAIFTMLQVMQVKTVSDKLVISLIKLMFRDSYTIRDGNFNLIEAHASILRKIETKCEKLVQYRTARANKKEAEAHANEVAEPDAEEVDALDEDVEEEVAKPAAAAPASPAVTPSPKVKAAPTPTPKQNGAAKKQ